MNSRNINRLSKMEPLGTSSQSSKDSTCPVITTARLRFAPRFLNKEQQIRSTKQTDKKKKEKSNRNKERHTTSWNRRTRWDSSETAIFSSASNLSRACPPRRGRRGGAPPRPSRPWRRPCGTRDWAGPPESARSEPGPTISTEISRFGASGSLGSPLDWER